MNNLYDPDYVFGCPRCGKGSTSEQDAEDGYCGACHAQTAVPVTLTVGPVTARLGHVDRDPDTPMSTKVSALLHKSATELSWLQFLDGFRASTIATDMLPDPEAE